MLRWSLTAGQCRTRMAGCSIAGELRVSPKVRPAAGHVQSRDPLMSTRDRAKPCRKRRHVSAGDLLAQVLSGWSAIRKLDANAVLSEMCGMSDVSSPAVESVRSS